MKYLKHILLVTAAMVMLASCYKDEPDRSQTIYDDTDLPQRNEFDRWLLKNYTFPYNIEFNYLYNDKLTNNNYNVIPATRENSQAMAILIKNVWLDAYVETAGENFIKNNSFRVFQLIGSPQYDGQGKIVLGTAEGGIQVTLFRINELDIENIYVNQDDPYRNHSALPLDLNYWYFHTMHHEFCHILTQKKNYSTDFQAISAGKYHSADWVNVEDKDAAKEGFVTGYASGEYNEDFAEVYSTYVTSSDAAWKAILANGVVDGDDSGKVAIEQKLEIIRSYLLDSWGIDLEALRTVVLRRSSEAASLDLKTLK
ncbi:MAG: putative zinc-binding metallopeptidase [Candidatus Cryptobacteroides sp.]